MEWLAFLAGGPRQELSGIAQQRVTPVGSYCEFRCSGDPADLPNPRVLIPQWRSVAMRIKSYELSLIALSTPALLWMSPPLFLSSKDTVFYRFANRASRISIDCAMRKSGWEEFR